MTEHIQSPGADYLRAALTPDPEHVENLAQRLSAAQGRALSILHLRGSAKVSNTWGAATIPWSTATSLCDHGLAERYSVGVFTESVRLTRLGTKVVERCVEGSKTERVVP